MKNLLLLSALFLLIVSCSDNSSSTERKNGYTKELKTPEDSLFQDVMDGHDVAMAKMGKLAGYRKQAVQKADSLVKLKSPGYKEEEKSLRDLADSLQKAENNMNTWMVEFNIDSASDDKSKRLAYLEAEKIKVNMVKDQVLSSIAKADSLLKK